MYLSIIGIHNSIWKKMVSDTTWTLTRMFESYPLDCLVYLRSILPQQERS